MIKDLEFLEVAQAPATHADVTVLEASIHRRTPTALAEFLAKYNGGIVSRTNGYYPVPSKFDEYASEYGLETGMPIDGLYGLPADLEACNISKEMQSLADVSSIPLLPISYDLLGNYVVLQLNEPQGPVYWWDHERWDAEGKPHLVPIADNLEDFYNGLSQDPHAVT